MQTSCEKRRKGPAPKKGKAMSGIELAILMLTAIAIYGTILAIAAIMTVIARWRIFNKAGEAGWKSLIPVYSDYVYARIATNNSKIYITTLVLSATILVCTLITPALNASAIADSFREYSSGYAIAASYNTLAGGMPIIATIAALIKYVIDIIVNYKLAQAFDETPAFGILLSTPAASLIAMFALAFDKNIEYLDPMD
jgi:hypothetical protein